MRRPRLKLPADQQAACYHCVSRVVDQRFIFDPHEKDRFLRLLHECAQFCRVRLLTFCVMSNHFHLLVEVPQKPAILPSPDEIVADLRRLTGFQFPTAVQDRFEAYRKANDADGLAAYLATFHARMYDLSAFLKLLKQRLTQSYNARHQRKGTLWEERFKSVLVEGIGDAVATMAAYIDLNPVRAGLVKDPKDYRWSGYGAAMGGRKGAKVGLQTVVKGLQRGQEESLTRSLEVYRKYLYLEGDERRESLGPDGRLTRGALSTAEVEEVLRKKGRLPVGEYVRCRVRYFCDGLVLGGKEYVEGVYGKYRDRFGEKRKNGARVMRGLEGGGLYTVRDLRVRVFGTG